MPPLAAAAAAAATTAAVLSPRVRQCVPPSIHGLQDRKLLHTRLVWQRNAMPMSGLPLCAPCSTSVLLHVPSPPLPPPQSPEDQGQHAQVRPHLPLVLHREGVRQEQGTHLAVPRQQVLQRLEIRLLLGCGWGGEGGIRALKRGQWEHSRGKRMMVVHFFST